MTLNKNSSDDTMQQQSKKHKRDEDSTEQVGNQKPNDMVRSTNSYDINDNGPFRVHLEFMKVPATENREIQKLTVAQVLLKKLCLQGIADIKKLGRKTVTVYFNDYNSANSLINNNELDKFLLRSYIPDSYLFVSGVIRGVEKEVDVADFKEELQLNYPVTKLERMQRYDKTTNTKVDTNNLIITLRTNKLPDEVKAYRTVIKIFPFVGRIKQCCNCLRFGHLEEQCKARLKRCERCGEAEHQGTCKLKCVHCKKDHVATDVNCEERKRQSNIKLIMAKENIGYYEALEMHPTYTQNPYALLENAQEFPVLERKTYAAVSRNSPRSRLVTVEKSKSNKAIKKPEAKTPDPPVAVPQANPLAGPAYEFVNQHKTTVVQRIVDNFKKKEEAAIQHISRSYENSMANSPPTLNHNNTQINLNQTISDWNEDAQMGEILEVVY